MVDRPPQPADDDNTEAQSRRRLTWRLAGAGLIVLGLLVVYVFWVPRWMYPSLTDNDLKDVITAQNEPDTAKIQELKGARLKLQNDARTTLLQGLGAVLVLIGAGIGANATLRQVKATRDQIRETATASRNQLKLSEQGQVTDRYTKAVEQLGHEKAPVRLGALYSVEHLAQDNPEYRQTVVDVVCAYLRMPYTLPVHEDGIPAEHSVSGQNPTQEELQVRQTAQRILAAHLQLPPGTLSAAAQRRQPSPQQAFWPRISLDLSGATLTDFNFQQISVIQGWFDGATFQGAARFDRATFHSRAGFSKAAFEGDAVFREATFEGDAGFSKAAFEGEAMFREATFKRNAEFWEATFKGDTWFSRATFEGNAEFWGATFKGDTGFSGATFKRDAVFREATFKRDAVFREATFNSDAVFKRAAFERKAVFREATFKGDVAFREATFEGGARFGNATFNGDRSNRLKEVAGALVLHVDNPDLNNSREWPDGYTVRPGWNDPTRGRLVHAGQTEEHQSAVVAPPTASHTQQHDADQTE